MASLDDIQLLERSLIDCAHLEWIVSGRPVVALFSSLGQAEYTGHDRCYLGQPSIAGKSNDGLRLWIGVDEGSKQLLITLTLRIRMTTSNKYRLFYLCLPTDCLKLEVADPAIWRLSKGIVPTNIVTNTTKTRPSQNQTSRLLRTGFSLEKGKSWVIMPQYPSTGRISSQAMSSLRKLKTLSEVSAFDLFSSHDSWFQQALLRAQNLLTNNGMSYPKVQYSKFYPAGRAAGLGCWDLQGWHDPMDDTEEDSNSDYTKRDLKRKRNEPLPPPYKEVAPLARSHPRPPASRLMIAPVPPTAGQIPEFSPDGQFSQQRELSASLVGDATLPLERASDAAKNPIKYLDLGTSEFDDLLLNCTVKSTAFAIREPAAFQDDGLTFASLPCQPPYSDDLTAVSQTSCDRDSLLAIPREVVSSFALASSPPICSISQSLAGACTPEVERSSLVYLHDTSELSFSCIPETPADTAAREHKPDTNSIRCIPKEQLPQILSLEHVVPWLADLWRHWPYAHYTCISYLLQVGTALSRKDADSFHMARAHTLAALLDDWTIVLSKQAITTTDEATMSRSFVEDGVYELISWLTILDSNGDTYFCSRLIELATIKAKLQDSIAATFKDRQRYHHILNLFTQLKAEIVLGACMEFGARVLSQDKLIASKMASERDRVKHWTETTSV